MYYFIISASEDGFLCLTKIHTTLSEHSVAFCCNVIDVTRIVLAASYDDFSAFIFVVLTCEFWGNVSLKWLCFVSLCHFKLEIFITAIVSWHIKHMGLILVGERMNAHFSVHSSLNCQFSLSTFLLAVNLEHAIFVQSRLLQPAKCQYANCSKNCLCIVGMETRPRADPTKTHSEAITVRGPQIRGLWAICGPGAAFWGPLL